MQHYIIVTFYICYYKQILLPAIGHNIISYSFNIVCIHADYPFLTPFSIMHKSYLIFHYKNNKFDIQGNPSICIGHE